MAGGVKSGVHVDAASCQRAATAREMPRAARQTVVSDCERRVACRSRTVGRVRTGRKKTLRDVEKRRPPCSSSAYADFSIRSCRRHRPQRMRNRERAVRTD